MYGGAVAPEGQGVGSQVGGDETDTSAGRRPVRPASSRVAPCSRPSRPLRAACGGGLRPVLTAAARGAMRPAQAGTEKRPQAELRNIRAADRVAPGGRRPCDRVSYEAAAWLRPGSN